MGNPWVGRRVLHWAHQGGAREAPSSTLFAMHQAVERGADAIELDVHATKDRHVVVCHDATVDRTTDATGRIADLTLAEVQALDNAHWWADGEVVATDRPEEDYLYRGRAPGDASLGIPTLHAVLDAFPDTFLNFDIKQTAPAVEPYEQLVADILREHSRTDDVIVASFDDRATDAFSVIAPEICTSMGMAATAAFYYAVRDGKALPDTHHVALQVPHFSGDTEVVTKHFVDQAHGHGLVVHVWTIDDADEMAQLIELGVDGIMTDRPAVLEGVLQDRGVAFG